jgi:hypothetical protein
VLTIEFPDLFFAPVLSEPHIDRIHPDWEHVHLDRRFLPEKYLSVFGNQTERLFDRFLINGPSWDRKAQITVFGTKTLAPPVYRPWPCLRELPRWRGDALSWLSPNDACVKALWVDGKPHCPHQGLQLAQFWDGEADVVRCPMHGLAVKVRED